jgi:hypothetical protein
VVIQGPLYAGMENIAQSAVESVRQHLPEAEIIVSLTDSETSCEIDGAKLIYTPPPIVFDDINGNINNVNKLIISVQSGLSVATRKYVIKTRSDHRFESDAVLTLLHEIEQNAGEPDLFSVPVGLTNLFLRNPVKTPYLFHLSDTVQFGRTEDLQHIWAIDLVTKGEVTLKNGPRINPLGTFQGYTIFRLVPEQSVCLKFLATKGLNFKLKHSSHTSLVLLLAWEKILTRNFRVYDWSLLGIKPPDRFLTAAYSPNSIMSQADFNLLRAKTDGVGQEYWSRRYARLLINKYLLCWFNRRWLVSSASLLLFTCSPNFARKVKCMFRKATSA